MTRRGLIAAVVSLVLAACGAEPIAGELAAGVAAPESGGNGPPVASAIGGAHWFVAPDVFGFEVENVLGFAATKLEDGSANGQIDYHQRYLGLDFHFVATVTCMNVYDGNRVKYGGLITGSNDPDFPAGGYIWFQGIDNGEGEGAPADLSTISGFGDEAANQAFCASSAGPRRAFPVNGNIDVRP